ncbi:MAG: glycosyltransferase family 1 protein [Pseudomonadota bacterium]
MRILLATDAWQPQVNGVVRTIERLVADAATLGADIYVLGPDRFYTVPLPTYSEIRLAMTLPGTVARLVEESGADYIHIATEGPIGMMVRRYCMRTNRPFTTSYHTRFPEYVAARIPVPVELTYGWLRRFHNAGRAIMVTTDSLAEELRQRGFDNPVRWPRGVDSDLFRPQPSILDLPKPIFMYVGRVAVEKNLDAFLSLDLPGSKVIVGDGPQRIELSQKFPDAHFLGTKLGEDLAAHYASADVFVFPSRTDTLGLVVLEALAAGVPIAAYPVTGPKDIIGSARVGVLSEDLREASLKALDISPDLCREHALKFSWLECARIFLENVRTFQDASSPADRSAA